MKTIRFRVWDGRQMHLPDRSLVSMFLRPDGALYLAYDGHPVRQDGAVVMLSTGLTDREGREVFEGDVIGYDPRFETEPLPVVWEEGGFKLRGS